MHSTNDPVYLGGHSLTGEKLKGTSASAKSVSCGLNVELDDLTALENKPVIYSQRVLHRE